MATTLRSRVAVLKLETDTTNTFITIDSQATDIGFATSFNATSVDGLSEAITEMQTQKRAHTFSLTVNVDLPILNFFLALNDEEEERDYEYAPAGTTAGLPKLTGQYIVTNVSINQANANHQTASVDLHINSLTRGTY